MLKFREGRIAQAGYRFCADRMDLRRATLCLRIAQNEGRLPTNELRTDLPEGRSQCVVDPARPNRVKRGESQKAHALSSVGPVESEKRAAFRRVRDELADWLDRRFGEEVPEKAS